MEDLGERLDRMEELICSIAERLTDAVVKPLPAILTRREAARELSISLSRLKAMIRSGEIAQSLPLGQTRGIPRSEILRLATPTQPKSRPGPKGGGPRKPRASGDAQGDAAEYLRRIRDR